METAIVPLAQKAKKSPSLKLAAETEQAVFRFPRIFDCRLTKGLERLLANCPTDFCIARTPSHLKKIVLSQYAQQKKIENELANGSQKPLSLKLFKPFASRLSVALVSTTSRGIQKDQVVKALRELLPSVQEVSSSFYQWYHPELNYLFFYFEVQKLRGKDLSPREVKALEKKLMRHLTSFSLLTPSIFWPYNNEDSFRQIQLLQREMKYLNDLPQVSIHFQEQTATSLEFLVHIVRPTAETRLDIEMKRLPNAFPQFHRFNKVPFPIEMAAFSITIPSFPFEVRESINLLYARRFVAKQLENIIGPLRDTNGGLLEIQQQHFDAIRAHLGDKIPHFDLFAERVFYALHPVETWLTLSLSNAAAFLSAFSSLIDDPTPHTKRTQKGTFAIIKNPKKKPLVSTGDKISRAQISLGDSQYLCLIGPGSDQATTLIDEPLTEKTLRLVFQEGPPPSLNPQYSCADLRSRILNKLLFEGLTRLNEEGKAELAGAESYTCSPDGTLYQFKLRESHWSNGEKVTAADYVSSWQSALAESINHPEHLFILKGASTFKKERRLGIRAIDPATLQIELEKPDPSFLRKLAQPFFFPVFGAMREPKWFNGPFTVRELDHEKLVLEKNIYYWDAENISLEQIHFRWIQQSESIFAFFEKGEIDWIGDPLTVLNSRQIQKLQEEKRLHTKPVSRRFSLYFSTKHPLLRSPKIRKAMSLAIDRHLICKTIFPGGAPLSPATPFRGDVRQLFLEGLDELGLSLKTLPPLNFIYTKLTRREQLADYLKTSWQELFGLPIRLEGYDWNHFRSRVEERAFDVCVTVQDTLSEGTLEFYEKFEGPNSWNFSEWIHPEYRQLLNQSPQAFDRLDRILAEETPFSPLFDHAHLFAHHPSLEKFWIDEEGCIDFSRASYAGERNVERKII